MRNPVHRILASLVASFALAHGPAAAMEDEESEFVRSGFYLGAGGSASFADHWNSDFDDHLNQEATELANQNAQAALDELPPPPPSPADEIVPLSVTVNGADLEDAQFGVNGVLGYRAGALVAFEVEGEWLLTSNESDLNVDSRDDLGAILQKSNGSHTVEIDEIWTVTANVKVYPPFTGWLRPLARFQPFAKAGVGVQHSRVATDVDTSGLTTPNQQPILNPPPLIVVPADFRIRSTETNFDGAFRVGGGIDIYATRNIVSEINATYVLPFTKAGSVKTDYLSVQWRLVYRF